MQNPLHNNILYIFQQYFSKINNFGRAFYLPENILFWTPFLCRHNERQVKKWPILGNDLHIIAAVCSQFVKKFKKSVDFRFYIWYKYSVLFVRVGILRPARRFVNPSFTTCFAKQIPVRLLRACLCSQIIKKERWLWKRANDYSACFCLW